MRKNGILGVRTSLRHSSLKASSKATGLAGVSTPWSDGAIVLPPHANQPTRRLFGAAEEALKAGEF